jgi:hypothetical protein
MGRPAAHPGISISAEPNGVIQDIIAAPSGCSKNDRASAVTKEGKELKTG